MRIISGSFKGKKIIQPNDLKTRPLKDLVKESIFNIINHSNKISIDLQFSEILDLFSGVGSFGIECLSRGARKVTFIENYRNVLLILKKNLINLNLIDKTKIFENDIFNENTFKKLTDKYDIIFIDPPFKNENLNFLMEYIYNLKLLKENGLVILHRHYKEKDILLKNFKILESRKYGLSKIIFGNFFG